MKLVIDTNEIFSFFNPRSHARSMAFRNDIELHAPAFALEELEHIKPLILARFLVSEQNYVFTTKLLKSIISFSPDVAYEGVMERSKELSPDPNDADFFALALTLKCPIWSEDAALKNQNEIDIYSTQELSKLLEWA